VLLLFSLLQLLGLEAGGDVLQLLSLAKALAFIVLVAACFLLGGPHPADLGADPATAGAAIPRDGPLLTQGLSATAVVVALQAVITTFDGWHSPIYFAEEFTDPERDLPRSLIGGVLAIIGIYLLVNLALLHVLPLEAIAASKLPVADATRLIFGGASGAFIAGLVLLSLLGLVNATIMAAPRILYGLARDGLVSRRVAWVSRSGTPVVALVLTALVVAALVVGGNFRVLLGIASFLYVVLYLSGIVAMIVLRRREPALPRPFLAWGHPAPALVVLAGSGGFLVAACLNDSRTSLLAALLVVVGLIGRRLLGGSDTPEDPSAPERT
jgi:APA family basic amino acid/polyamine antiporter